MTDSTPTRLLADAGVSIWLDDLSRAALDDGSLVALIDDADVTGVTTNPSIFHAAITTSHYDSALAALGRSGAGPEEAVFALTTADVAAACSLLAPTFAQTNGVDGRVSIEVDPRLARDASATIDEARRLFEAVNRPNVLVKIPATVEGLEAIEQTVAAGISVNVTLIFSLDRYRDVIRAYQAGLHRAAAAGLDLSTIHSVASFFVSRVDAEVDRQLEERGAPELQGTAAIANARLAYELYQELFSGAEWDELQLAGAQAQRPLWASTGVKNPAYADTAYVTELVAPGVVNTMPRATLDAVRDHGVIAPDTITGEIAAAHATMDALASAGISYDEVVELLEVEGLAKFEQSWIALLNDVARRLTD